MNPVADFIACGLSVLFLVVVFIPMEWAFPAKPGQKIFRPDWTTDLLFLVGQYMIWNTLSLWAMARFETWISWIVPQTFRAAVAQQSWWLQLIEILFLTDFSLYWGHRLQHRVPLLWRFHSIHHTAEHLDWLAAHRDHPLDTLLTIAFTNLPAFILGFPLETIAGLIALRGVWAIYLHSNVRLPMGPLGYILGSPQLHHWHHDKARDAGNYANLCPLMDLLFGTHVHPDHEPDAFGIQERSASGYIGLLLWPFRR
jgi:sterol desaturase/sphingolipid hydroxylase (fatty acid hydroxylase superfamily)